MAREIKAPMETIVIITRATLVHVFLFGCNTYPITLKDNSRSLTGQVAGICFIFFLSKRGW